MGTENSGRRKCRQDFKVCYVLVMQTKSWGLWKPSLPAQASTHQGASDVVDQDAPGTSATSLFNNPFGDNPNNDLLLLNHSNNVDFDKWVQGVDTTSRYATCPRCRGHVGANENLACLHRPPLTEERQTSSTRMPLALQLPPCSTPPS